MTAVAVADRMAAILERWEPVIGMEVHCQLRTTTKMFCACSTAYDGAPPNSHTCPVCLGLPGALPTINRAAVEHVLTTGLAIDGSTPVTTRWDRKNYFYPDLPKGYQISQYDLPLVAGGRLTIETSEGPYTIGITRAHLEEDTAKLIHSTGAGGRRVSLVDFNRSGAPLMEIVTEPDLHTPEQARRYGEELQLLLRTIGVSDADMERGQMRVEANVSLRERGTEAFGTRTEVKNMNSFRSVERAVAFEIERQARALEAGEALVQETRGWNDDRQSTYTMRVKEDSDDYRYFPEPDLPPLNVEPAWLDRLRAALPELPAARRARYVRDHGLSAYDAEVLVAEPRATTLFEEVVGAEASARGPAAAVVAVDPKAAANWVAGSFLGLLKTDPDAASRVEATELADLIRRVGAGDLSGTNAKEVFAEHAASGGTVASIIETKGFRQISDSGALGAILDEVFAANPQAVADFHAGKPTIGFLVGAVMKQTRGQANAVLVQAAVRERLDAGTGKG